MNRIQNAWDKTKKTLKFVWRHFFTFGVLGILLSVFVEGPLNWKNAFFMLATSIFLDWVKQFIKLTPRRGHPHHAEYQSIQPIRDQWWDSTLRGSAANFLSNMDNNRYK
jgi:hypothetical protein